MDNLQALCYVFTVDERLIGYVYYVIYFWIRVLLNDTGKNETGKRQSLISSIQCRGVTDFARL